MQHLKMLSLNVTISNLDCSAAQKKNNPSIGFWIYAHFILFFFAKSLMRSNLRTQQLSSNDLACGLTDIWAPFGAASGHRGQNSGPESLFRNEQQNCEKQNAS